MHSFTYLFMLTAFWSVATSSASLCWTWRWTFGT